MNLLLEILTNYWAYALLGLVLLLSVGVLAGGHGNRKSQENLDQNSRRVSINMGRGRRGQSTQWSSQDSEAFRSETPADLERRLAALQSSAGLTLDKLSDDSHGVFGEAAMAALVARAADSDHRKNFLLHNVYVPARSGTTEIDVLLLHESGIYVFESKNLSGEISGSLEMERWQQVMNEKLRHDFHNPLQQNQGHINALRHFLQLSPRENFTISYVVFSDRCLLKKVPADGRFFRIVHCSEVGKSLYTLLKNRRSVYTGQQLEGWFRKLYPCAHVSEKVKAEHNAFVQGKRS